MTADLSVLPNSAILLQIVAAKRKCLDCSGVGAICKMEVDGVVVSSFGSCQRCDNTGKVPILDAGLMRLPCPGDGIVDCWKGKATRYDWSGHGSDCAQHNLPAYSNEPCSCGVWPDCLVCKGRNWVPNPDAWAMRKALGMAGFRLDEGCWFRPVGEPLYWANCGLRQKIDAESGEDADPEQARYLAVAKAFGI